jgi:eukaryotic-like serine/threonine-protein kinase
VWIWSRNPDGARDAATRNARPAIAIMSFDNLGGANETAWLSAGLPSMLVTGLAQNPELEVVTTDRLNEAARQIGRDQFSAVDPGSRLDVVRRAGATIIVNGTIIRTGDELRIDARVEDLAAGRVVLADNVRGKDPLALADDLAARIRRGLNVRTADSVRPVAELTSTSVEAYRLFALGVEAANNIRTADAQKLFEQALALDPSFALAHLWIFRTQALPFEERVKHLSQAAEHLDRLSERDALSVEADVAVSQNRNTDAIAKYERLIARYPDSGDAYVGLAITYGANGEPARAVAVAEQSVKALPTEGPLYNMLGYMYLNDGRTTDAIAAFENYVKLRPAEPNALDSLAEGQLVAGDVAKAIDTATKALKAGRAGSALTLAWIAAIQGRYDDALKTLKPSNVSAIYIYGRLGRYRDAEAGLKEGLPTLQVRSDVKASIPDVIRAVFALERGDCRETLARMAAARKLSEPSPGGPLAFGDLIIGTCEARTGQLAAARARFARHRSETNSAAHDVRFWTRQLEGEIALAAGDLTGAEVAFRAGEPVRKMAFNRSGVPALITLLSNSLILRDGLARVRMAQGRFDEAVAIYRRLLVVDKDSKFTSFYEPRYVLAIARLLEKTGKKDDARAEYKRFLEFWKNADADLPELAEARAKSRQK